MALRRLTALIAAVTLATATAPAPAQAAAGTTGFRAVEITGDGGVTLKANVIAPAASGRHPAVILPSSWGLNDLEYLAQARILAERGYVVVSYTPRGWWLSGGEIDTAGPKDMADLTDVIDWTIANTATDPARIGAAGISYGAGISLLGAAFDSRIRAVGVLSGWTDLVASLYADQTRHRQSAGLLELAAKIAGKPSAELTGAMADFNANVNISDVMAWAKARSAATYLDRINANNPAVLIANGWGDTFFPPNQLVDFYAALTTPKRLELRPGDHAIAELTGVLGLPNEVWTSLRSWLDAHLATGTTPADPIYLKPLNAAAESYPTWSAQADSIRRYGLGRIRTLDGTGLLGGAVSSGWTKKLPAGKDTVANGGIVLITNGAAAITGRQPSIWLPLVDRSRAGVWAAERPSTAQLIRGKASVHLELSGTARTGTVVAYLYDLDLAGNAELITHAPATWLSGSGSRDVDLTFPATAYNLPAGHSLTLVVDTADPLYYDENESGASITIGGGSFLDVPIH